MPSASGHSYLGVEFVITQVQGGVDGSERLKVDVDFLFFAFVCDYGSTVDDKAIGWDWKEQLNPLKSKSSK